MNKEQAFLQAIRERPGAYANRLVYADWLMDQGNPRGEFISCQVRASRLPRGSPQRLDLEAQAHDLLLAHEADWLGPLVGMVANWEWRGGLLDFVTVAADVFLAHAPRWLPALPLLGVHLRKAQTHFAALARCEQLAHLNALYLGDNHLTDDHLEVLLDSPHLRGIRALYLHSNDLGVKGIRLLATTTNLPRLREMNLGNNRLGTRAITALAASPHLRRLRVLYLPLTLLKAGGIRALAGSPLLARLRHLGIGMNHLAPGCLAALARAPAFASLRELTYELNQPSAADVTAVANSPHAAGLRYLGLDAYRTLNDRALKALAAGSALGQLRTLTLGSGNFGPAGVRALGRSRTLTALRTLRLIVEGDNDDRMAQAFLGQPLVRRLRHLDLESSRIGREGLAALASHPRPLRLRELDLPLSSDMAAEWETILNRRWLAWLTSLTLTSQPPGSLRALLGADRLPQLRRLTLHGLPNLVEFQELLNSPLLGRLHALRINLAYEEESQGPEVIRRLCAAWHLPSLRRLGLLWSLSPETVRLLAAAPPPPALTELEVGVFRFKAEGMAVLAGSPLLRQLRRLELRNSSSQAVPGLEALAESPHVGPLLRVDIRNGHVPAEAVPAVRRRFGGRFAVSGRMLPRTISLGGWHDLLGDGED
jgi:uncharacterized protein (TIGR02996 family)